MTLWHTAGNREEQFLFTCGLNLSIIFKSRPDPVGQSRLNVIVFWQQTLIIIHILYVQTASDGIPADLNIIW